MGQEQASEKQSWIFV